jgi:MFS family permease
MPVVARDVLQGGPHTLGFLMGSIGVGALAGALYLASRKSVIGLSKWIARATAIFGVGLVALSFSKILALSMALLFVAGFGMMVQMASSNTILQTIVDDDKRGRIMSLYTMAFLGMAPFGSLLVGSLASNIGAMNTIMINGLVVLCAAFLFWIKLPALREKIRPIYKKIGIIPEVSTGIQSATQLAIPPED